jgi:hypothetical protein
VDVVGYSEDKPTPARFAAHNNYALSNIHMKFHDDSNNIEMLGTLYMCLVKFLS